jgi:hypothetical protein
MSRRGRWTLVAVVLVALVVIGWATVPGLIRRVSGLGVTDIHDAASLPDRIRVCGRGWILGSEPSRAQVRAQFGGEPMLVDPLPFAPCPTGPCTQVAQNGPCDTVVFVRVGEDAYLAYALQGGP